MVENLGTSAPDFKKFEKCYLNVSNKVEIITSHTSHLNTYLGKFSEKNMAVRDSYKKVKMKFCYTVNSIRIVIIL
jgi:hypothetical protein